VFGCEFDACQKWYSGVSKVNLVCGKTRVKVITRNRETRLSILDKHDTNFTRVESGLIYIRQYSDMSKVNLGCGKVPTNRKLCSREMRKLPKAFKIG
jgi:hypothetical protein